MMAGTNLEARGSIYTPASHPQPVTAHSPPLLSLSSAPPRELRHLRRATAEKLTAGSLFRHKLASSPSSSLEILEVITATPLAAMEPESPRQASKSEAPEGSARSFDTESAMPETSGGDWDPCNLNEEILFPLEREGCIAAKETSRWRVEPGEAMPAPSDEEIIMLKSHIDRGLSLPPSYFLREVLRHYRLQLHHIAPNSFTALAGFVALCEGYLGISPRGDLFRLYFNIRHNQDANRNPRNCGSISFVPRHGKSYPYIVPHDSAKGWRGSFFYLANQAPPERKFGLRSFTDGPPPRNRIAGALWMISQWMMNAIMLTADFETCLLWTDRC
jgi:hypothetical protein